MRVTSSLWVAAFLRRCHHDGAYAVVRRRGAAEAGAIFVVLDRLDGTRTLYAPAPQSAFEGPVDDRRFAAVTLSGDDPAALEARLAREIDFDSDLWVIEVEDRAGRHFLDLVP
jgi:hypothetical protein